MSKLRVCFKRIEQNQFFMHSHLDTSVFVQFDTMWRKFGKCFGNAVNCFYGENYGQISVLMVIACLV